MGPFNQLFDRRMALMLSPSASVVRGRGLLGDTRFRGRALTVVLTVAVLLALLGAGSAAAEDLTSEQEALARKIEGELIAPCCNTQTVDVHESEAAELIKSQIRMMVAQGKAEDEIMETFVAQYGETILAAPRASGFNLVAYVLPVVIALIAAAAIAYMVIRWRRRPAEVETVPVPVESSAPQTDDALRARLEQELKDFDR